MTTYPRDIEGLWFLASISWREICTIENVDQPALVTIPQNQRNRAAGSFINRFRKVELYKELRHTFSELEQSPDRAISVAAAFSANWASLAQNTMGWTLSG